MRTRSDGWPVAESRGGGTGERVGRGGRRRGPRGGWGPEVLAGLFPNHEEGKWVDGLIEVVERVEDLRKNRIGSNTCFQQNHVLTNDFTQQRKTIVSYSMRLLSDSDESDEDEPSEVLEVQRSIHHLSGSPTPSFDPIVDEEKSSGSTTTHSDYSLLDYEAFYFDDDHIEEKSSGSTTTHSYFSLPELDSFMFDLSIDLLPPATDPGEFTSVVEKNIFDLSSTKDSKSIELNDTLFLSDYVSSLSKEFSEIDFLVLFTFGNEDIIFDLRIFIIKRVQSKEFHIFPLDDFPTFSFVSDSLLLIDPFEIKTFLSFPFENEDKVFDLGIFFINGVFSFTRRTPHLLRLPLIVKTFVLVFNLPITRSPVDLHIYIMRILNPDHIYEVEIIRLKERVKILEDKEGVIGDISGDDAPIKGRSTNLREAPAERISTDSEEIARVLTSMDAATVLVGELMFPLVVVPFPLCIYYL
nr:hypothetical protein [Tanacetum cinerariifolium]